MSKIRILLLLFITLSLNIFLITGCSKEETKATNPNVEETLVSSYIYPFDSEGFGDMYQEENGDFCCIFNTINEPYSSSMPGFFDTLKIYNVNTGAISNFIFSDKVIEQVPELRLLSNVDNCSLSINEDNSKLFSFVMYKTDENNLILGREYNLMKVDANGELMYKFSLPEISGAEDLYSLSTFNSSYAYSLENENLCFFTESISRDYSKCYKLSVINPYTKQLIYTVNMEIENSRIEAIIGDYVYFHSYDSNLISIFDINTGENIGEFEPEGYIQEFGGNLYSLNESGIYKLSLDGSTSECILNASDSEYYVCSAPRIYFISEKEFYCSFETGDTVDEGTYSNKAFVHYILK